MNLPITKKASMSCIKEMKVAEGNANEGMEDILPKAAEDAAKKFTSTDALGDSAKETTAPPKASKNYNY